MSSEIPQISLPQHLLPSDGRFGSGPSKVRQDAVSALAAVAPHYLGTSHRQASVRSVVGHVRRGLAELFSLPGDYEVVLGNGGSTVFWDAAIFGIIEQRSRHLSFGEFSSKFAAGVTRAPHLDQPDIVESPPGTCPEPPNGEGVDTLALTHNETSTGVAAPVERPDAFEGIVLVDGTSAAGGLRVDPSAFDVYYFAPQKCFGADGGLWLALCSPAAVERIGRVADSKRWTPASLDLSIALEQSRADQTYNTPALTTLFLLAEQIDWINDRGGLEWAATRCDFSAALLYGWATKSPFAEPFVATTSHRSQVTATIDLDASVDAPTVAAVLRANGILDTEPYRKLGRNQLRIALFPSIEPDDVATLTHAIDYIAAALQEGARAQQHP